VDCTGRRRLKGYSGNRGEAAGLIRIVKAFLRAGAIAFVQSLVGSVLSGQLEVGGRDGANKETVRYKNNYTRLKAFVQEWSSIRSSYRHLQTTHASQLRRPSV